MPFVLKANSARAVPSAFACNPSGSSSPLGGCPRGPLNDPGRQGTCAVPSALARNPSGSLSLLGGCSQGPLCVPGSQPLCAASSADARNPSGSANPSGGGLLCSGSGQEGPPADAVPSAFARNPSGFSSPLGGFLSGSSSDGRPAVAVSSVVARNTSSPPAIALHSTPPPGPLSPPKCSVGFRPRPPVSANRAFAIEPASRSTDNASAVAFSLSQPGEVTVCEPASVAPQYHPESRLGFSPSPTVGSFRASVQEPPRPLGDAVPGAFARNPVACASHSGLFEQPLGREPVVELPYASSPGKALSSCHHESAPPADATVNAQQPGALGTSSGSKAAPGSNASTFLPADLWVDFFTCLGSAKTSFASFWHSIRSLPRPERGPLGRVWPMPVPFPSLHRPKANRRQADAARKLGLNALVLVLSWLSLSCPATAPPYLGLGASLSKGQWAAIRRLSVNVSSWNQASPVDWTAMGRSAAKVENAAESMRELALQARAVLEQSNPWSLGDSARILASAALPLDPSRIAFTGVPEFDPRPILGPREPATL